MASSTVPPPRGQNRHQSLRRMASSTVPPPRGQNRHQSLRRMASSTVPPPRGQNTTIWIIGDSYVRRGAQRAAESTGGNLGLNASIRWFGWGGLRWRRLLPFFLHCLRGRAAPDVLLIHCGGNDLGETSSVQLVNWMKEDLHQLHHWHPHYVRDASGRLVQIR
ncbi:hypothetical protein D5F01_LYC06686 [Larimichthys crocea]|uniref:SGNH hydrolase-type esterase domain-containing protein n=2 Tax=Larimichthys crocea TaxID=215358 RepID=A0A6G0IR49_LARCR|nr:hypothetical protein D5F01_LYC06686 [Larimichthys crocea]